MLAILLGIAMSVLDNTLFNLALPAMSRDLGTTAGNAVWIVNGFQIAALVGLLPLASLGDRISYRRVYLAGAAAVAAASVVASMADSLELLVAVRVVQGLGAAGIMATTPALVRYTYPPELLRKGVSLNAMVVAAASVAGPVIAAAVLSMANWRALFILKIPLCLLVLAVGWRSLPSNESAKGSPRPGGVDIALNAAAFVLFFATADTIGRLARGGPGQPGDGLRGLAMGIAAAVIAFIHVRRQLRHATPLLPLDLLRIPILRLSAMSSVCAFSAQAIAFIVVPFLLLDRWGTSTEQAGFFMSAWPLGTIATAFMAGSLIGRLHNGYLGALGMAMLGVGLAVVAATAATDATSHAGFVAAMVLCGLGFGLFQSPNNHTILTHAPVHRTGAAGGLLSSARLIGQTLGASVSAIVLTVSDGRSAGSLAAALAMASVLSFGAAVASAARVSARVS